MKLDMHCHTKEGSIDGKVTIEEYIQILKEKGYDGMVVTDHNSYDGYRTWEEELKGVKYKDFVVLKGVEYDTIDGGHVLVIMPEYLSLKILELRGLPLQLLVDLVHRYGGIAGPAHPCGEKHLSLTNTGKYRRQKHILSSFDFLEEFNSCETEVSNQSASMLSQMYHIPGVGGSDSHFRDCVGMGYTLLEEDIATESDLIAYIQEKKPIFSRGMYYDGTIKAKIGKMNRILVESFWFYNKLAGAGRRRSRRRELQKENLSTY